MVSKELRQLLVSLSEQLRLHRAKRNIGIRGMASEIGISSATLSRIENESVMSLESYIKVTDWLASNGYFKQPTKNSGGKDQE